MWKVFKSRCKYIGKSKKCTGVVFFFFYAYCVSTHNSKTLLWTLYLLNQIHPLLHKNILSFPLFFSLSLSQQCFQNQNVRGTTKWTGGKKRHRFETRCLKKKKKNWEKLYPLVPSSSSFSQISTRPHSTGHPISGLPRLWRHPSLTYPSPATP